MRYKVILMVGMMAMIIGIRSSDSVGLHPVGWCSRRGWELQKPQGIHRH